MKKEERKRDSFDVKNSPFSSEDTSKKSEGQESISAYYAKRLSNKIYRAASGGMIGRFLSSYDLSEKKANESYIRKKSISLKEKLFSSSKRSPEKEILPEEAENVIIYKEETVPRRFTDFTSEKYHSSKIVKAISSFKNMLLDMQLSCYGVMLIAFSIVCSLIESIKLVTFLSGNYSELYILSGSPNVRTMLGNLAVYVILIFFSLVLITSGDHPFIEYIFGSRIIGGFAHSVMGMRSTSYVGEKSAVKHYKGCFLFGAIAGILPIFMTPLGLLLTVLCVIYAITTLVIPELGIIILFFIAPFIALFEEPFKVSAIVIAFVAFSVLIKVIGGERVVNFSLIDISVFGFLLIILFSGLSSRGGKESALDALYLFVIGLSFPVIASLFKSRQWIKRSLGAISNSGFIVALIGIVSKLIETLIGKKYTVSWVNQDGFSSILDSPASLAAYMLGCIFVTLALFSSNEYSKRKGRIYFVLGIDVIALLLTGSKLALISLLLSLIFYAFIKTSKSLGRTVIAIAVVVILFLFFEEDMTNFFAKLFSIKNSSVTSRLNLWNNVCDMIRDNFIGGIGVGKSAFSAVYPLYSPSGSTAFTDSRSLYLQIILETGICGITAFIILIVFYARTSFTLFKKYGMSHRASRFSLSLLCGVSSILLFGLGEFVFSDCTVYLMFFSMIGVCEASYRKNASESLVYEYNELEYDIQLPIIEKKKYIKGEEMTINGQEIKKSKKTAQAKRSNKQ